MLEFKLINFYFYFDPRNKNWNGFTSSIQWPKTPYKKLAKYFAKNPIYGRPSPIFWVHFGPENKLSWQWNIEQYSLKVNRCPFSFIINSHNHKKQVINIVLSPLRANILNLDLDCVVLTNPICNWRGICQKVQWNRFLLISVNCGGNVRKAYWIFFK